MYRQFLAFILVMACLACEEKKPIVRSKALTAEEQKNLTPDSVIALLKSGNQRFLDDDMTYRDHSALVVDAARGQHPAAVILSCMDSRVPVEDVFDLAIGDAFVCRVAGNVVNEDILGSLEYGTQVSGAKVILVLGHRYCGAIQSAIKNVELGNITQLLQKVKPAIDSLPAFTRERSYSNPDFVTAVAIEHVKRVTREIPEKSPILKDLVAKGQLKIIAAGYDLNNGKLVFFE